MKSLFKNPLFFLCLTLILLNSFLIFNYVFSWTLPQCSPPNCDLPAPLDTSSVEQTKTGNLNLENNLNVSGILRVGLFSSHPTGTNGAIYYNTIDHKFYGYKNGSWSELGGGGGFWLANGNDIYYTNGNVGIGTTSPSHKLDIALGSTNVKTYSYGLETTVNTTGGWARAFRFRNENDNVTASFGVVGGDAYIATGFDPNSDPTGYQNQRLTVTSSGNVGIGTTSPSEKLEVSGNIKLSGSSPTYRITNVASPINDSDVATKGYVDLMRLPPGLIYQACRPVCQNVNSNVNCGAGWTKVWEINPGANCSINTNYIHPASKTVPYQKTVNTGGNYCISTNTCGVKYNVYLGLNMWNGSLINEILCGIAYIPISTCSCTGSNTNQTYPSSCAVCCQ